ncbi:glycosyltransferase family 4 protein [Zunongwangia sp. F363]|uniref:Glycosyltransferase family 4 protein n=1 Tax=Autumnicola tepida TaxID=3075595 RepID=A0ABU3C7I9_9FLAO|nr:glycosyltransferase family 4 protein [Zunongwangia sp. F363]MDT0642307.1 glycosyltransferase family 4 protein [Zunongwangia sp. F363]
MMHIGIASPITIQRFSKYLDASGKEKAKALEGLKAPAVDAVVEELLRRGHTISIYTLAIECNEKTVLFGKNLTIFVGPFRKSSYLKTFNLFKSESSHIRDFVHSEVNKPEILHAQWTYEFSLGLSSFRKDIPVFVTVRDWAPAILRYFKSYYRLVRLLVNNAIFRKRELHFISNSPYISKSIKQRWNIDSVVIPNPISNHYLEIQNSIDRDVNTIISVSNSVSKLKNIKTLLVAFQQVLIKKPNLKLRLVGNPFYQKNPALKKWRTSNLFKNVELCGPVTHAELVDLYDESSIMVHPSLEESFGNTLIEAMARNTAVIGGKDSGAVPHLLGFGNYGVLCDVTCSTALACEILRLCEETGLREELVERAREYVLRNYTIEVTVDNLIDHYKKQLSGEN